MTNNTSQSAATSRGCPESAKLVLSADRNVRLSRGFRRHAVEGARLQQGHGIASSMDGIVDTAMTVAVALSVAAIFMKRDVAYVVLALCGPLVIIVILMKLYRLVEHAANYVYREYSDRCEAIAYRFGSRVSRDDAACVSRAILVRQLGICKAMIVMINVKYKRRLQKIINGLCPRCGYSTKDAASVCPECGG